MSRAPEQGKYQCHLGVQVWSIMGLKPPLLVHSCFQTSSGIQSCLSLPLWDPRFICTLAASHICFLLCPAGWRLGFLSFPWALVFLPGVGQDIGSLGQLNSEDLWFHPGKGGTCMGHQGPRTPVSDQCPPLGGADVDYATDYLLQPWSGAHHQPQPQRRQG